MHPPACRARRRRWDSPIPTVPYQHAGDPGVGWGGVRWGTGGDFGVGWGAIYLAYHYYSYYSGVWPYYSLVWPYYSLVMVLNLTGLLPVIAK